jgi:Abnormal spindle-like microcephaly-assoc'd, ASPM-SPD-2-Hydin/Metallo-peptidase family M12B Reprolysin-like
MLRARRTSSITEDTTYLPQLEILEPRLAMTVSLLACDNLPLTLSHGGACSCPICSGQNLESLFPADVAQAGTTGSGGLAAASPISALPQLSSHSAARVKLYLDFNGNFETAWGSYSNVTTRVFDRDGDATTFSDSEISTIREIWARVAEDFSPFNIDVTTVDPGNFANGNAVRLAIGGNYSDWFGQSAGGVAYVGGFTNSASNTGYVFEDALGNGNARYVAEATSHEAGHLFGLLHQSTWANGQLQAEYNAGNSAWAPIMGVGYSANRTTWHNGNTNQGANVFQDDVSILANGTNNFGLRADDYSNTFATPSNLSVSGTSVNFAGLVGSRTDVDVFQFNTGGGSVTFQMNVAQFGNNLDGALEIRNAAGTVVSVNDPGDSFGASLSTTLAAGSYFLVVRGSGTFGNSAYGNMGQYTVTGTVPAAAPSPEISVLVGTTDIADGGTIDFGSTTAGTAVSRVITVRNVGTAPLSVNAITSSIPAGFTLVSNLSTTTLQAGQSITFTVRLNATSVGSFAGNISFANSDANEGTFDLRLQGTVGSSTVSGGSIRTIDDGAAGNTLTGIWRLGTRGREGDVHVASRAATVTASSRWSFTSLAPGQYRVYMSWTGDALNATNAPVTVLAGTQNLGTTYHNQRVASAGYTADGTNWLRVRTVTITGNSLTVYLSNLANGNVVADAVRIERVVTTSGAALGAVHDTGSEGSGVFVASLSSRGENQGGDEQQPETHGDDTTSQQHAAALQSNLDLAPELGLLEETLDLVRELSRHVRSSESSSGLEDLFNQDQDWLSVL